jgi:predicted transcriptional regulator with HTH domain
MLLKILDYLFFIKSLSETQKKMCKEVLQYLYQLIPFGAHLAESVQAKAETNSFKFEFEDKSTDNVCAPLEFYII